MMSAYLSTNGRSNFPERDRCRTRANDSMYISLGDRNPRNFSNAYKNTFVNGGYAGRGYEEPYPV